ncbi:MAG: hypothetical protein IKU65_00500 [Oscillospiraceae bacterium]|nr:hypothetical protein [Oscillospiraceae bacterium]
MKVNIAAVGLGCPFEIGFDQAASLLDTTAATLNAKGINCINTKVVMHDLDTVKQAAETLKSVDADVLLICIATWSEDHHLLDLLSYIDKPIILRAYPAFDTGSLCCAHQIGAVFTDIGAGYEFVYGEADDDACADKTKTIATAYALKNTMGKVRMGALGGRVKGMTEIAYDEFSIKQKLGARIVNLDEKELTQKVEAISDAEAEKLLEEKKNVLAPCKVLSKHEDMLESMKFYGAMRQLVDEYDLSALSVKCYTTYMGKVCLGYSLLAEEGIVASCEGDVTNALTMKLLYELSEQPINNTDLLYPDEKENTILFAHCGSSGFSIAGGEVELAPVRLAETGVCSRFIPKTGTVTLVDICGHGEQFRMSVMVGEAIPCEMLFPGNPAVVKFEKPVAQICDEIMQYGSGHHWMVAYGDWRKELESFCKIQNMKYYEI